MSSSSEALSGRCSGGARRYSGRGATTNLSPPWTSLHAPASYLPPPPRPVLPSTTPPWTSRHAPAPYFPPPPRPPPRTTLLYTAPDLAPTPPRHPSLLRPAPAPYYPPLPLDLAPTPPLRTSLPTYTPPRSTTLRVLPPKSPTWTFQLPPRIILLHPSLTLYPYEPRLHSISEFFSSTPL